VPFWVVLFCLAVFVAGCDSTPVTDLPQSEDSGVPAEISINQGDNVTPTATSSVNTTTPQNSTGRSEPTTTAVSPTSSPDDAVESGVQGGGTTDVENPPTSSAPQVTVDPDTVEPEEPELFTEEPSDKSGLFGTEEPGSSA